MTNETRAKILEDLHRSLRRNGALKLWRSPFTTRWRQHNKLETKEFRRAAEAEIDAIPPKARKRPIALLSFFLVVLLPLIASTVYYTFVASDQFVSEARFAVRAVSGDIGADSVDSGILSMDTVSQDAYVITSFIHSSEMLRRLSSKLNYSEMFSGHGIDFLSRLNQDASQERILEYWNRQVQTYIDGPSGIVTLKVKAFDPDSSKKIASLVLQESDALVNELSQRAKDDIIKRAEAEVHRTEGIYTAALNKLQGHQTSVGILDPERQASETGKLLSNLITKKIELDSRIFVINSSMAQNSPAYRQLTQERAALDVQIEKLKGELTGAAGSGDRSLAAALKNFSELETDRIMGEKLYEAARSNLAAAQEAALKKAIYLVVFVNPDVPQMSTFPNRISSPFILFLIMSVVWLTGALVWASVEDHRL